MLGVKNDAFLRLGRFSSLTLTREWYIGGKHPIYRSINSIYRALIHLMFKTDVCKVAIKPNLCFHICAPVFLCVRRLCCLYCIDLNSKADLNHIQFCAWANLGLSRRWTKIRNKVGHKNWIIVSLYIRLKTQSIKFKRKYTQVKKCKILFNWKP